MSRKIKRIFTLAALLLIPILMKADTWRDPSWQEMLDSSAVIVLAEVTQQGDFRAKVKPVKFYKGFVDATEIWVTGFSNRYGPVDTLLGGKQYLLFLNKYKLTERGKESWQKSLKERPELGEFYAAINSGTAYYVWSPTAGEFKVEDNGIQYNLLQTTQSHNLSRKSFSEFEEFLKVVSATGAGKSFHRSLLTKLKKDLRTPESKMASQYLMMLHFSRYTSFHKIFDQAAADTIPETRFALARFLGNVKSEKSRELLAQLLKDKNSLVQGEAVRQLSKEDPEFIGPLLISQLNHAGMEGIYPSNLMDPVRNEVESGKIEIINTLGEIKYKPAVKALLPLLETDDEYLFQTVLNTLVQLESKAYVPYINEHLKKGTPSLIFYISNFIARQKLSESKLALMGFISSLDKNQTKSFDYTVSNCCGLGSFEDQETVQFLLADFQRTVNNKDSLSTRNFKDWVQEYMETFTDLKTSEARPIIYQALFHWSGIQDEFGIHPELVTLKNRLEATANKKVREALKKHTVKEVKSIAFIKNPKEIVQGKKPKVEYLVQFEIQLAEKTETSPDDENFLNNEKVFAELENARTLVSKALAIPIEAIGAKSFIYVDNIDDRINEHQRFSPVNAFYKYAEEVPDLKDLNLLKALAKNGFTNNEYELEDLNKTIATIEKKLSKTN